MRSKPPRRVVLATWSDGWTLSRMPRMESGAWFVIESPDHDGGMLHFRVSPQRDLKVEVNEMGSSMGADCTPPTDDTGRPYPITEDYRRKVVWFLFDLLGLNPDQVEGLSMLHPSIPSIAYDMTRDQLRLVQLSAISDWLDVCSEDVPIGRLFPGDPVRRSDASAQMTDVLIRHLHRTMRKNQRVYPRELDNPHFRETRWEIDVDMRPYILVVAQDLKVIDDQPVWRLHRWDDDFNESGRTRSRGFELTHAELDHPSNRHRLLGTSKVGPFELLEEAGLVVLEGEFDAWIDAHIDVPILEPAVGRTMEAYDLLDRTLDAPVFASSSDFMTWFNTLEST